MGHQKYSTRADILFHLAIFSVSDALYGFLGWGDPACDAIAAAVGCSYHSDEPPFGTEGSSEPSEPERKRFVIEAKLPSLNWVHVLGRAPSVAIESAWREGGSLPGTHCRLHLSKVEDAYDVEDGDLAPSWERLCGVEHEWWDNYANEPRVGGASAGLAGLEE